MSRVIGKTEATGVMHNLQNMLHAKFSNWQIVIYVYLHDSEIFISQILKVHFLFLQGLFRRSWEFYGLGGSESLGWCCPALQSSAASKSRYCYLLLVRIKLFSYSLYSGDAWSLKNTEQIQIQIILRAVAFRCIYAVSSNRSPLLHKELLAELKEYGYCLQ